MSEPSPTELIVPLPPLRKVIIKKPKPEINSNIKIENHGANPDLKKKTKKIQSVKNRVQIKSHFTIITF